MDLACVARSNMVLHLFYSQVKREAKPMEEEMLKRRDVPEEKTELEKHNKLHQWAVELSNIKDVSVCVYA